MNNILSYCGLVFAKIKASKKDLPVKKFVKTHQGAKVQYILPQTLALSQDFRFIYFIFQGAKKSSKNTR